MRAAEVLARSVARSPKRWTWSKPRTPISARFSWWLPARKRGF